MKGKIKKQSKDWLVLGNIVGQRSL